MVESNLDLAKIGKDILAKEGKASLTGTKNVT